ncbi:MAG: hypothetical protein AABX39_05040, partial [Nanoarchaeota archaeon]
EDITIPISKENRMGKLFVRKKAKAASGNDKKAKQEIPDHNSKQVQGVLVFILRPLNSPQTLLRQITEQQRSSGHSVAQKCIAKVRVAQDLNDKAFISEIVRKEFPDISAEELVKRTNVHSFQASDGNDGKYCIVFDHA